MARPRNSIGGIPVDLTHSGVHANLFNKQGVSLGEWMDRYRYIAIYVYV